jgi:hypothetical protein
MTPFIQRAAVRQLKTEELQDIGGFCSTIFFVSGALAVINISV